MGYELDLVDICGISIDIADRYAADMGGTDLFMGFTGMAQIPAVYSCPPKSHFINPQTRGGF